MQIKKANIEDVDTIIGFQHKMAKETEGIDLDIKILSEGVQSAFNDSSKGIYYVALVNDLVVASLFTTYEWSDWRNGCILWIQSVYVSPKYRQKGVFNEMYQYLKQLVENSDEYLGLRLYVDLTNTKAQKVYEKIGMNGEHYKMYEWFK